jgi:hypothetical protein
MIVANGHPEFPGPCEDGALSKKAFLGGELSGGLAGYPAFASLCLGPLGTLPSLDLPKGGCL